MPIPDIIVPLSGDTQAFVYAEAVEITRQGTRPMPGIDGLEDKWRISIPVRASLAQGGQVIRDAAGSEIEIPSPLRTAGADIADLLHDAEVQQALVLVKSIATRLITGDLKPLPIPEPEEIATPKPVQEPTP
jgi:hypothetical protein